MAAVIRVQLAGRHPAVLEEVRARLVSPSITVVGQASSVDRAMAADADVVVSLDGPPALSADAEDGGPALLVLGDDAGLSSLAPAALPAWGLLPRSVDGDTLRAAVTAVARGLVVLSRSAASRHLRGRQADEDVDGGLEEALTPREREVLELASQGLSNREVAATLGISDHTVKFHLASIYGKLGAGSRADAVRRGLRRGLISL